jgi:hypothetical protein
MHSTGSASSPRRSLREASRPWHRAAPSSTVCSCRRLPLPQWSPSRVGTHGPAGYGLPPDAFFHCSESCPSRRRLVLPQGRHSLAPPAHPRLRRTAGRLAPANRGGKEGRTGCGAVERRWLWHCTQWAEPPHEGRICERIPGRPAPAWQKATVGMACLAHSSSRSPSDSRSLILRGAPLPHGTPGRVGRDGTRAAGTARQTRRRPPAAG